MAEAALVDTELDLSPKTPEVFERLWTDHARYKGAWGGRGSGKSNDRAQAVVIAMVVEPGVRIACLREVQKSIIPRPGAGCDTNAAETEVDLDLGDFELGDWDGCGHDAALPLRCSLSQFEARLSTSRPKSG